MGRKLQIALAIMVVVLLGAAVGAYAWDSSRSDQIADGVTIGGVDVGGLTESQARALINHDLIDPIDEPITVKIDGVKYGLDATKLGIRADISGMVGRAVEASQEGGLPARIWRYATGGEVDKSIEPRVRYDDSAIDEFVAKVAAAANRDPVDASVEATASSLEPVEGKTGLTLDQDKLRAAVADAVQDPWHRVLRAGDDMTEVPPEVTTEQLAQSYPVYLTVDRSSFELKLWNDLKLSKTYPVAIGAQGFDTPAGLYHIQNKAVDPAWNVPNSDWAGDLAGKTIPGGSPDNPLKARWLGIYDGAGIHGTDDAASIGSAASHGCVRMQIDDVVDLYPRVPVGTPIYIG